MPSEYDPADIAESIRTSPEYAKGQASYAAGQEAIANPYRADTSESEWWERGWWDAYEADTSGALS